MSNVSYPNRLRVILAERQIKNRWLAEQLGKSEMTVSRWSTNKAQPSLEQFIEIAKLLDVKLDDLLEPYNVKKRLKNGIRSR